MGKGCVLGYVLVCLLIFSMGYFPKAWLVGIGFVTALYRK